MPNKYVCPCCKKFYNTPMEVAKCIIKDTEEDEKKRQEELAKAKAEEERIKKEKEKKEIKDKICNMYAELYKLCKQYSDMDEEINLIPAINSVYKTGKVTNPEPEVKESKVEDTLDKKNENTPSSQNKSHNVRDDRYIPLVDLMDYILGGLYD